MLQLYGRSQKKGVKGTLNVLSSEADSDRFEIQITCCAGPGKWHVQGRSFQPKNTRELIWCDCSPANSPGRNLNRFWRRAAAAGKGGTIQSVALTCEELAFLLWTSTALNEFFVIGNPVFSLRIRLSWGAKCRRHIRNPDFGFSWVVGQAWEGSSSRYLHRR